MNRPTARNALSSELLFGMVDSLTALDRDDGVAVVVVTGADPAFCAGLDLKELGDPQSRLADVAGKNPWPRLGKPLIAAVNGVAMTGGLELALNCDLIVASSRARFADTHASVGILPGWGLSVHLPRRIGMARALEASLTGRFIDADEALRIGLVNHVVDHSALLPFTGQLARTIAGADRATVAAMLRAYRQVAEVGSIAEACRVEQEIAQEWKQKSFDPTTIVARSQRLGQRGQS